jgi:cytochrome c-type biogenesis protein CcmH/NrfG
MNEPTRMFCDDATMARLVAQLPTADDAAMLAGLNEAIATFPADARLLIMRGALYASQGEHSNAEADLTRAVVLAPREDDARFMLGQLAYAHGDRTEAIVIWTAFAMEPKVNSASGCLGMAMLAWLAADRDTCKAWLHSGLQSQPSDAIRHHIVAVLAEVEASAQPSGATALASASHFLASGYQSTVN